jgi:ectoine hydroxylase-related dioxygenase (phytanoyl-CoA dioxygenase family)
VHPAATTTTPPATVRTLLPTVPLEAVLAALDADGAVIVHRLLDEATVAALRSELAPALALRPAGSQSGDPEWELFHGRTTRRATGLANWSPTFVDLVQHPLFTGWADRALLPQCGSYSLNSGQLMAIGPGADDQYLHRDQSAWPFFNGLGADAPEVVVNAMVALTAFTAENGATRVVPGSHRLGEEDRAYDRDAAVPAEMAPGSVLLFSGRTVHGAGANRTSSARHGLHLSYALGWLRTEENHQLSVPEHVAARLPQPVRKLLGFEQYDPAASGGGRLGLVDWEDPARRYAA